MPHGLSGALERPSAPFVQHATSSRIVKGEDVLLIKEIGKIECQPPAMLYMVCDGHSGVDAASFVMNNFLRLLTPRLPSKMPHFSKVAELEAFAEHLRKALCETFVRLDSEWSRTGHLAGTTVTAVLSTGWLLTVANTGDSSAIIDTGSAIVELTRSHRIHTNKEEQARLRSAGCYLASLGFHLQGPAKPKEQGVGPLRIWPGGLCVSRSIGDADAGKEIVPVPHIRQLLVPPGGCRIITASDGLWDVLNFAKVTKVSRPKTATDAAADMMTLVTKDLRMLDDTTIIVLDIMPWENLTFPVLSLRSGTESGTGASKIVKSPSKGGLFSCFKPALDDIIVIQNDPSASSKLGLLSDVDCLKAYPGLKALLAKNSMTTLPVALSTSSNTLQIANYTLHGGSMFGPNGKVPDPDLGRIPTPLSQRSHDVQHNPQPLDVVMATEVPQQVTTPSFIELAPLRTNSINSTTPFSEAERQLYARLTASAHGGQVIKPTQSDDLLVSKDHVKTLKQVIRKTDTETTNES